MGVFLAPPFRDAVGDAVLVVMESSLLGTGVRESAQGADALTVGKESERTRATGVHETYGSPTGLSTGFPPAT
jgi:hypothetical protein